MDTLFHIYLLATAVQLLFWGGLCSRLAFHRPPVGLPEATDSLPAVSVVICARNEAENLKKNIPRILSQNYRSFEIIVVNDHSTDKTWDVLLAFQKNNRNFTALNAQGLTKPGKKQAMRLGIEAARHDIILLTDADCHPASNHWITLMQGALTDGKSIGLGYGPYLPQKGFLSTLINYETVYTAVQYLSFSLAGMPYMGVGRNLIYRKRLFAEAGGFQAHAHLASGDDDLFVNQVANGRNTAIVIHPSAFTYSEPKGTWSGYYYQKSRHFTTGSRYRPLHQWALGAVSASHFVHYAGFVALLCVCLHPSATISLYLVRMAVVFAVSAKVQKTLREAHLTPWTPLLDALYVFYYPLFAPVLFTGSKHVKWK